MNRCEIIAYALAAAICGATLATGAVVSNVIMNTTSEEISTAGMDAEQIRLLNLWMGVE